MKLVSSAIIIILLLVINLANMNYLSLNYYYFHPLQIGFFLQCNCSSNMHKILAYNVQFIAYNISMTYL